MTARSYPNNSILERKKICSEINYYSDSALNDSTNEFRNRHAHDNTNVQMTDSVYYSQTTDKVKTNETSYYTNLGYYCECYK